MSLELINKLDFSSKTAEQYNLRDKFINNLLTYHNITYEDVCEKYRYAGGSIGSHHKYWELLYNNKKRPVYCNQCVCEQSITHNCYITCDNINFIIIGSCCINRFIPMRTRTCEVCNEPHKNSSQNRCNIHKIKKQPIIKTCEVCDVPHKNRLQNRCNTHKLDLRQSIYNCEVCNQEHQNTLQNRCNKHYLRPIPTIMKTNANRLPRCEICDIIIRKYSTYMQYNDFKKYHKVRCEQHACEIKIDPDIIRTMPTFKNQKNEFEFIRQINNLKNITQCISFNGKLYGKSLH